VQGITSTVDFDGSAWSYHVIGPSGDFHGGGGYQTREDCEYACFLALEALAMYPDYDDGDDGAAD